LEKEKEKAPKDIAMANNGEKTQTEAGRHQEVGHKSLLQSDALYQVHPIAFLCLFVFPDFAPQMFVTCKLWDLDKMVNWLWCVQYILETSVYPREPESMKELRELTAKHPWYV